MDRQRRHRAPCRHGFRAKWNYYGGISGSIFRVSASVSGQVAARYFLFGKIYGSEEAKADESSVGSVALSYVFDEALKVDYVGKLLGEIATNVLGKWTLKAMMWDPRLDPRLNPHR